MAEEKVWKKVAGAIGVAVASGLTYWFFIRPVLAKRAGEVVTTRELKALGVVPDITSVKTDANTLAVYVACTVTESYSFPVRWHIEAYADSYKASKDVDINEVGKKVYDSVVIKNIPKGNYKVRVYMSWTNPDGRFVDWEWESPETYYVPSAEEVAVVPTTPSTSPSVQQPPPIPEEIPEPQPAPAPIQPSPETYQIVIDSDPIKGVPVSVLLPAIVDGVTPLQFYAYPYTLCRFKVPKTYSGYNLVGIDGVESVKPQDDSVIAEFVVSGSKTVTLRFSKPSTPKFQLRLPYTAYGGGYNNYIYVYDIYYDTKNETLVIDVELASLDAYYYKELNIYVVNTVGYYLGYATVRRGRQLVKIGINQEAWKILYEVWIYTWPTPPYPEGETTILVISKSQIRQV